MKQKYVSDPFVRISLRSKEEDSFHTRRKSEGAGVREQKRTSVSLLLTPSSSTIFLLLSLVPLYLPLVTIIIFIAIMLSSN